MGQRYTVQYLLDNGHPMGRMEDITQTLNVTNTGPHLDVLNKFHIYRETKTDNQINDKHAAGPNVISDVTTQYTAPTSP
jgi:hypothetical protein